MLNAVTLQDVLECALGDGIVAVACLDRDAQAMGIAGPLTQVYAANMAREVNRRHPVERLFAGDVQEAELGDDRVAIAMVKTCLVVVVVLRPEASLERVRALRANVASLLPTSEDDAPIFAVDGGGDAPKRYRN